jgi:hypothetical protein
MFDLSLCKESTADIHIKKYIFGFFCAPVCVYLRSLFYLNDNVIQI